MRKGIVFIWILLTMVVLSGCSQTDNNQIIKPFDDIPVDSTKRIEFSNLTITSNLNESGRSKMVTNSKDIQEIAKFLQSINCIESTSKEAKPDFTISLIDNTEKAKNYIYLVGVSKNQIYKYSVKEATIFVYKPSDTKVLQELKKLYDSMAYEEEFLYKK